MGRSLYWGNNEVYKEGEREKAARYYLADFTGKRLKHSFHLNRLRLWHDALLTPTSVRDLLIRNAQDSKIAKLVDTLYSKHYNVYTLQEADPANEIISPKRNEETEVPHSGDTKGYCNVSSLLHSQQKKHK